MLEDGWKKQPTLESVGHECAAYTLGIARRTRSCDETWYSGKTNNVPVKLGHQEGHRWSKTEACGQDFRWPQYTRMADFSPSSWDVRAVWQSHLWVRGEQLQLQEMFTTKEAWKPHACGRRWQPRCWPVWRKSGWRKRSSLGPQERRDTSNMQFYVSRPLLDHVTLDRKFGTDVTRPCWRSKQMGPRTSTLWWTSTYDSEEKSDMNLGTTSGCCKFPFEDKFKILGCAMNRDGKTYDAVEERMQSANKAFWKDILVKKTKIYHGRLNVKGWWTTSTQSLRFEMKSCREPYRRWKKEGHETKTNTRLFRFKRQKRWARCPNTTRERVMWPRRHGCRWACPSYVKNCGNYVTCQRVGLR